MAVRMNRYARKRNGKRKQKRRYLAGAGNYSNTTTYLRSQEMPSWWPEERREYWDRISDPRNGGWQYWQQYDMSGPKGYARRSTNRRIRSQFRNELSTPGIGGLDEICDGFEDIPAMRHADYQKCFDYWWIID